MTEIQLVVYGRPAPQGSKRAFVGKSGRAHVIESSHDRVKSWRGAVVDAASAHAGLRLAGPLEVSLIFYLDRPKAHYGTGRNAGRVKASAPPCPVTPPDLSKLLRATEDALTDAGVWADDAAVACYSELAKCWADHRPPGADILIRTLSPVPAP